MHDERLTATRQPEMGAHRPLPAAIHPTPIPRLTVAVRMVWPFRAANKALGIDADAIWELEGISRQRLSDPDGRVSWQVALRLLRWSIDATGVEDLGLRAAEMTEPGMFDLLEYAARSQPTLGQANECVCRYFPLLSDAGAIVSEADGDVSLLTLLPADSPPWHVAIADFTLAYLVLSARRFTGDPELAPREVHLTRPAPGDPSRHQRFFRAPVLFGTPANQLLYDRSQLTLPLKDADAHLSRLLERVAEQSLRASAPNPTLADRVRTLVAQRTSSGRASAKDIARELGMVQRTLHRRLAQDGVTFRRLADEVRRTLALGYLQEQRLALSEIAQLLGFSGVPAFHRAFKRWTYMTPGHYLTAHSALELR